MNLRHPRMRRHAFSALLGLGVAATTAFGPAFAADAAVSIDNFTFKPAQTTVGVGTTVTFKNADDIPHSVVATDGSFHSKALDTGDEFHFKFVKAGDFPYHCGLHPQMQGKIIVTP